jgi:hypothetical protein
VCGGDEWSAANGVRQTRRRAPRAVDGAAGEGQGQEEDGGGQARGRRRAAARVPWDAGGAPQAAPPVAAGGAVQADASAAARRRPERPRGRRGGRRRAPRCRGLSCLPGRAHALAYACGGLDFGRATPRTYRSLRIAPRTYGVR